MRKELIFCDECQEAFGGECVSVSFNNQPVDLCGQTCFLQWCQRTHDNARTHGLTIRITANKGEVVRVAK